MIKIVAIFKDKKSPQYACITNQFVVPGVVAKCLFCFFDEKSNKWHLSWNRSNIAQLKQNNQAKTNMKVTVKDLPEQLNELIQQTVDKANRHERHVVSDFLTRNQM